MPKNFVCGEVNERLIDIITLFFYMYGCTVWCVKQVVILCSAESLLLTHCFTQADWLDPIKSHFHRFLSLLLRHKTKLQSRRGYLEKKLLVVLVAQFFFGAQVEAI